jgi:hypothetical protein
VVVVAAAIARRVGVAGHAHALCAWALGLESLGYDVVLIDALERNEPRDPCGRPCRAEHSVQWAWLRRVTDELGFKGTVALLVGDEVLGTTRGALHRLVVRSRCLLNVMGYLRDQGLLAAARRRVFVDIDPGYPQMWHDLGLHDGFAGHDAFVTVGTCIGEPHCAVPTGGYPWITTLPPVAVQHWSPLAPAPDPARVTSIATLRGPEGLVEHNGTVYGTRVHELRRFVRLPQLATATFELALAVDDADAPDRDALLAHGWQLADPHVVAATPAAYRRYICGSGMELMIAKAMYARTRCGWWSDRSACYLAAGRPVVAQDTGAAAALPVGEGVVTFRELDEAVEAIAEVRGRYGVHAKAARELAIDLLDAPLVIGRVLDRLDVG